MKEALQNSEFLILELIVTLVSNRNISTIPIIRPAVNDVPVYECFQSLLVSSMFIAPSVLTMCSTYVLMWPSSNFYLCNRPLKSALLILDPVLACGRNSYDPVREPSETVFYYSDPFILFSIRWLVRLLTLSAFATAHRAAACASTPSGSREGHELGICKDPCVLSSC